MQRTSNIFARVEPEIKEQAEQVLSRLGIPMSNAIGLFLRQVIMQKGIPFDMKLPVRVPLAMASMDSDGIDTELEKGYVDAQAEMVRDLDDVTGDMHRDYGL